jgi:hypothetical protein
MPKKQPLTKRHGPGCLMLFALPFACFGAFMGWRFFSAVATWRDAARWVETPAAITSLELKRHRGDEGGTSYSVKADYNYEFAGRNYSGDRVGLFSGSDNVSNYNQRLHARLKEQRKSGSGVCYVNPFEPSEALLDRGMRLGMLAFHIPFVLLFGGFGFGALAGAAMAMRSSRSERQLAALYPDEPWRWNPAWESGTIRAGGQTKLVAWVAVAVAYNLVCGLTLLVGLATEKPGSTIMLIIAGLNLAGLLLAAAVAWKLWRRLRYGVSELQLASTPGVVGGQLTGVVIIPAVVAPSDSFLAKLECQEQRTHRSSDGESTQWNTTWDAEQSIRRTLDSGDPTQTNVPVSFTIPSDAKATDPLADKPVKWELKVTAETPGPGYEAQFEVPVFLTEDSCDGVTADEGPQSEYAEHLTLEDRLALEKIRVEANDEHQLTIVAPPLRQKLAAFLTAAFTVGWCGVAVFLFQQEAWIPWIIAAVFAFFGLVLIAATIETALSSSELSITGDRWVARNGWYGLRPTKRFTRDKISRLSLSTILSSTTGSGPTKSWKNLKAKLNGGKQVTLVTHLSDRHTEQALLEELRRRAGLDDQGQRPKDKESPEWDNLMDLPAEE